LITIYWREEAQPVFHPWIEHGLKPNV